LEDAEVDSLKLASNNPSQNLAHYDEQKIVDAKDNRLKRRNKKGSIQKAPIISDMVN
jgi:hypothetical protein